MVLGILSLQPKPEALPVGTAFGTHALQGPSDHLRHVVVVIKGRGRAAMTQLFMQALQTQFSVAVAPPADGHAR